MTTGVLDLATPFERHRNLPTAMNWLGEWDSNTLYYSNDIVISPINGAAYILVGTSSSLQGGGDPSVNDAWYSYGGVGAQIVSVRTGDGIKLTGGQTNPEINNTGVNSVQFLDSVLQNIGTATNVVIDSSAVTDIGAVLGIRVDTTGTVQTITNTGVTKLQSYTGIGLEGAYPRPIKVVNTGVLTVESANSALTVTAGQIPQITNNGVLTLTELTGIGNSGTATEPIWSNLGVFDLSGDASITIGGNRQNPTLVSNNSRATVVWNNSSLVAVPPTWGRGASNYEGKIAVSQVPNTLWAKCVGTGVPYAKGVFILTIPFVIKTTGSQSSITLERNVPVFLYDSTTNIRFQANIMDRQGGNPFANDIRYNTIYLASRTNVTWTTALLNYYINLDLIRKSGFRTLTDIIITNNSGSFNVFQTFVASGGPSFAVYYPFDRSYPFLNPPVNVPSRWR